MSKIEIFYGAVMRDLFGIYPKLADMMSEVNDFLAKDGKEIKVLGKQFQATQGVFAVMVEYEDLSSKA